MKKLIFMAIGAVALYRVAKYLGINSWSDVRTKAVPKLVELRNLVYS
jgi:hypothetical protein